MKNLKKAKDLLIKTKKKGWIKKIFFIDKEKNNGDKINENKIIIDKVDNNKNSHKLSSKLNFTNLNIINEEESSKKLSNKNGLNNYEEEEKKDDNYSENEYGEINMFNKIFKKSQDDFGINLVKEKESKKSFKCSNSSFSISKFRDHLIINIFIFKLLLKRFFGR